MEHVQIYHLGFYLLLSFYDTFNLYHVTKRNIIYAYFEKKNSNHYLIGPYRLNIQGDRVPSAI